MSEKGVVDKRDLAQMVVDARAGDVGARDVAMMIIAFAFWNSVGCQETDPDVSAAEADAIIAELPTSWDRERE